MLRISSILIFVLCFVPLFGQDLIRYTTKQGLPSNHVYDIAQDTAGFMWFATNRGIVKFDGVNFKTFTIKDGLPNNDTWKLEADFQGRVWYFSKSNYQGYIQKDSIYKFRIPSGEVINPGNISKSRDNIWMIDAQLGKTFTVKNEGLVVVDPLNSNKDLKKLHKEKNSVYNIFENPIINEFILLEENRISFIDTNLNVLFSSPTNHLDARLSMINYGGFPNRTFYLKGKKGLIFISHQTKSAKYYSFKELVGIEQFERVYCKALMNEIQVSVSGYLMRFNYSFDLIEKISFPEQLSYKLSYKDIDGNIWFADLGQGITFQPNSLIHTKYYFNSKNIQKIDKINQSLFIGIPNEGFYELDFGGDSFKLVMPFKDDNIYQISYNQKTKTGYLATNYLINQYKDKSFLELPFIGNNDYKWIVDFDDSWYALTRIGLLKKERKGDKQRKINNKQGLISAKSFKNALFIGASDGLYILENDSLIRPQPHNELFATSILSFFDAKNYLIVGTDGRGAYLYNKKEVIHLNDTDDLSIQKIIEKEDAFWMASQKGVFKLNLDTLNASNSKIIDAYYEEDGLLENNTNDIYMEDNRLYVASDMGLAKLDLKNQVYRKKPKLYFKTPKDTLYLAGGDNTINIDFSVLDYVNQENLNFSYRLLPNQEDWITINSRTINFSSLAPNWYTLEVKAVDQHGNHGIKRQYIMVFPAWWQTIWTKIGLAAFTGIVFIALLKFIQIRIKNKAEQEKRVAGLELQALRSQMNPHFVHNSLNAIQYYIQRSENDLSEEYLEKFSKLIRLFFEFSRKQHISISREVQLLNKYLEIEKLRFEEKLQYSIRLDEEIDQREQLIPSMILQPIVENAVNHGLFHKEDIGTIDISFHYLSEISFKVLIKDDGIGINKAKEIFEVSSKNYQSRSSEVLYERLNLLKQSNIWDINYQIEDLSDSKNTSGTLVTLTFNQLNN